MKTDLDPRLAESLFLEALTSGLLTRWGDSWKLVRNLTLGRSEADVFVVDAAGDAFVIEVKWGDRARPVHIGALAQIETVARETSPLPEDVVLPRDFKVVHVTPLLATNMRVSGQAADLARGLHVEIVSEDTDDPRQLAVAVLNNLEERGELTAVGNPAD